MHNSREAVSTDALSGGSNLATTLSLNACPYLATSFFRYRPRVLDFIEATTILTQRGWAGGCMALALLTLFVGLRLVP